MPKGIEGVCEDLNDALCAAAAEVGHEQEQTRARGDFRGGGQWNQYRVEIQETSDSGHI